jgi:hypothetical protein
MHQCQVCANPATLHITEMVDGKPMEYHVCEKHAKTLGALEPAKDPQTKTAGYAEIIEALLNNVAHEKIVAHLLPALCLALLDQMPEVRIAAAFYLNLIGADARSAKEALTNALQDEDERVREAAHIALGAIEDGHPPFLAPLFTRKRRS